MPLIGPICAMDDTPQLFETCIKGHQCLSAERNCHCPTAALIDARDNAKKRRLAGVSASTLLSCARAVALQEKYDYYESPESMWSKYRGSLAHIMMEEEFAGGIDGVIQEERFVRYVTIDGKPFRVSGQMDRIYPQQGVLIDYKSKAKIPAKIVQRYVWQLSIYRWILADGEHVTENEEDNYGHVSFDIQSAGIHYITFNHKAEAAWLKVAYPLMSLEDTDAFVQERAEEIYAWQETKKLPSCNDLEPSRYWPCDCKKLENQLRELGTWNEDDNESEPTKP